MTTISPTSPHRSMEMEDQPLLAGPWPAHFSESRAQFEAMLGWLEGDEAAGLSHSELESHLEVAGRELLRRMLQAHLDVRAQREQRLPEVVDAAGIVRNRVETGRCRALRTVFGPVQVSRLAYRRGGHADLHPGDAELNLPQERHSHGLRRLTALEAQRGSFEGVHEAVERATGERLGKRQLEALARRAAIDFDAFYAQLSRPPAHAPDLLILSCDGKGIVMRPDGLRPATAQAAERADPKLQTRLSPGEKRNRKRMAEIGAVYDATPAPRDPVDVLASSRQQGGRKTRPGPIARNKWLVASVREDAAQVVGRIFTEAERRDPDHRRTWVALVDGNTHQIERIQAEARSLRRAACGPTSRRATWPARAPTMWSPHGSLLRRRLPPGCLNGHRG